MKRKYPNVKPAQKKINEWRLDPVAFVREVFGVEPDKWQVEFLYAFRDNQRIAAKACKGPGKTAVLAWCAWNFLVTRPHPKMAATSISGDNLKDGFWTEMAKWQNESRYLKESFIWTKTRIYSKDHPETWYISARQWPKGGTNEQQADTLAGLHADFIMFIIDEAGGIPESVMAAADAALATGKECKILMCGNPTHLTGPLYRACTRDKTLWHVIEITGDPDAPNRSPRIKKSWALEQIAKYGIDNPWVLVNVFGKFPPSSLNALLGPDDMEAAYCRVLPKEAYAWASKSLGVDVAREGDDKSVIAPKQGLAYFQPKILRIPDTMQLAGVVAQAINKFKPDMTFIDGTGGYGAGVIDALRSWGYVVTDVKFNGKAIESDRFVNKRAEMAWNFAQHVKSGACLPRNDELTEECTAMEYFFKGDKIQIIEKKQIKELIGRSPDLCDAYMLNHAFPVAKKNPIDYYLDEMTKGGDYDPMIDMKMRKGSDIEDDYNPLA